MAGKTLHLKGLTADLNDQIKGRLELYFRNKRKSGGEISELRADPTDRRRVLLVYDDDQALNKVLSQKIHRVDLRGSLGVVPLSVTLPKDVKAEPVLSSAADCNDDTKEEAAVLRVTSKRRRGSLEMFFEHCISNAILRKHGTNTWLLQISKKSDMESVFASNPQQYGISVELYKEKEDMVDKRRYVLRGMVDSDSSDIISMYINSCSHRAQHSWEAMGGDTIVITFKEDIDSHKFMQNVLTKSFKDKKIEAWPLELTKSVIVQGDMTHISEDFLELYFSNKNRSGGAQITSFDHVNQDIVITFEDWKVAQRVAEGQHTLMGKEFVAQLFYPDLQWVLTGQTNPQSNFLTDITIPVTPELLSFISRNEIFRDELTCALQRVKAMVSFNIVSKHPHLELKMSMAEHSLGRLRHGPSWETNVRREVQTNLEKYMVEHIPMDSEVWQAVKSSTPEVNVATALISFKICSSELVVVGRREEMETLVKEIKSKMEKARDELQILKNTSEKEIQFDSRERLDLTVDNVQDETAMACVELSKNIENLTIHLKGPSEKVQEAETFIHKFQDTLTSKKLDYCNNLTQFWQFVDLQKFQNEHFSQDNIVAVVIPSRESVTVLAKKGDMERAEKKLREVIKQEGIPISVEYNKELFGEQWDTFYADLTKDLKSTRNDENIFIYFSGDKIELCGFCSVVDDVFAKVKECLENKKVVTEIVALKTVQEVNFVESELSADPQLKALGAIILPCRSSQSPCLKVTATSDQIKKALDVMNMHKSQIITRKYMYSKAGEAKILKKNTSTLKMQAKELGCNLEVSEKICQTFGLKSALTGLGNLPTGPTRTPLIPSSSGNYPHSAHSSLIVSNTIVIAGVSVILKKADITQENVDVIVNSNNNNLDLNLGVSGAILNAAGQSVVDECMKHGPQVVGNVVLTSGGNLNCKYIAQIAGSGNITAAIGHVLQLCESKQAVTVSMPSIGTGRGGSTPEKSAKAILQAVKTHMLSFPISSFKKIFVVAFEDGIYDRMKKYFNKQHSHSKTQKAGTQIHSVPVITLGLPLNQVQINHALIELKKGNITAETVKAIVNSTNEDVNLNKGVSGAILKAAGAAVEAECAKIRPLKGNDAGVTSGGGLQCDFIIHIVGPKTAAQAIERVKNVLKHCEDKKIASVSFPAIGTGGGGMTFPESTAALLLGIKQHLSQHNVSSLKQIFLVVDQDLGILECQKSLLRWTQDMADEDDSSNDSSSEEDTSGATTGEMLMGTVKVKIFTGDITKETTDAIVNSTNASLNLATGVSGAILKSAGQSVVDECNNLGNQPSDGVVITKPGNLTAKHIIHMVGQTKEKDIISSMMKILKMCEDHNIQSISFPALGTGAGQMRALDVGIAMVTAVEEHIKITKTPILKNVHIVIFQITMIQDFLKSLKKYKKGTPAVKIGKRLAQIRAPQGGAGPSTTQPSLCLATACRAVYFPEVEVDVLGCSSSGVEKVKKLVDDLVSNEWRSCPISSPLLSQLLESDKKAIVDLSRSLQVCVSLSTQDKATASGKTEDALNMVIEMGKYLQSANEWVTWQEEAKRLRETVRWEVSDGGSWAELDPMDSLHLENARSKKEPSISYTEQQQTYTVNLDKMERTDGNGTIAKIKRTLMADSEIAVIEPPANWDRMDNKTMVIVDLSQTSEEYKTVQGDFLKTSKDPNQPTPATFTVVKIQRIQNMEQWQRYAVKKQMLDKKYPKTKNEMNLYHGTAAQICQKLNSNGFNRSFCGKNATMFGNGTYFARSSWYSCNDTYSIPDAQGLKYMYQARVLVGKPCLGLQGMVEPNPLDPANPQSGLHDCAVNNITSPSIYVVFCDAGAYPEYLISFKAS